MRRIPLLVVAFALLAAISGCKDPFLASGIIYRDLGQFNKAEACFRRTILDSENNDEAYFELAYILSEMSKTHITKDELDSAAVKLAEASDLYDRASQVDPEKWGSDAELNIQSNYATVFNKAVSLAGRHLNDEARAYFELAMVVKPNGEDFAKTGLQLVQIDYTELRAAMTDANDRGDSEAEAAARAKGEGLLELLARIEPETTEGDTRRQIVDAKALTLKVLGRDDEANSIYETMLAENPEDLKLILALADGRLDDREFSQAASYFERAIALIEQKTELNNVGQYNWLYNQTGVAYYQGDEYEQAIGRFEQALELESDVSERMRILNRLAVSHFQIEDFEKAAEVAITLTDMDPGSVDGWMIRCRSLNRIPGRENEATQACNTWNELRSGPSS